MYVIYTVFTVLTCSKRDINNRLSSFDVKRVADCWVVDRDVGSFVTIHSLNSKINPNQIGQ